MLLDLFLKFLDTLVQLATLRDERRKNMFAEVYKPLFAEFEKIHIDYLTTFSECLRTIDEEDFIQRTIDSIEAKRMPLLPARQKIIEYIRAVERNRDGLPAAEQGFSRALAEYFGVESPLTLYSRTSLIVQLLEKKTAYDTRLPIRNESEAEAFLDMLDDEPTFVSYGVSKYITEVGVVDSEEKKEIAVSILRDQIRSLSDSWADVCYAFTELHITISRL